MTASKMAPGNLVLRQWCLIDLFEGIPSYRGEIEDMVNVLSYKAGELRLWAESYSYYNYTRDILDLWVDKFMAQSMAVKSLLMKIDQGFMATAYLRYGMWYPAPYGDLRNEPLRPNFQISHNPKDITIANVSMRTNSYYTVYTVKGHPIGLNTHIPKNDTTVSIIDGFPQGFKFYEGYDKKYKNSWEEMKDTLDLKRVGSLFHPGM